MPHVVVVGSVGKDLRNVGTVRRALKSAAPGALHVTTRANDATTLALSFGKDSPHILAGNDNVQKVRDNGGKLLYGVGLWQELGVHGITRNEFLRQVAIVLRPPPPQPQPQPARAPARAPPAPQRRTAPAPAPAPAPPSVDLRRFAAAQRLALNGCCSGCSGPVMFQVALEPLGVNADICAGNKLVIAAGQPFLICRAFHEDGEERAPACVMRAHAGNCHALR